MIKGKLGDPVPVGGYFTQKMNSGEFNAFLKRKNAELYNISARFPDAKGKEAVEAQLRNYARALLRAVGG